MNNYSVIMPHTSGVATGETAAYKYAQLDDQKESVTVTAHKKTGLNERVFCLLNEYKALPFNWDKDGAAPPDADALHNAYYLYFILGKSGQKIFHTAPGPNGEIMLDLRNEELDRSVEIIFYPKNKSVYVTFSNDAKPKQGTFKFDYLSSLLEWLNDSLHG